MSVELLKVENLVVQYRTDYAPVKAINGISLNIMDGETLGLVGETGAGKTTTALSIIGLIPNPPEKFLAEASASKGKIFSKTAGRK